jgi:Tol biopolymer transport system component
VLYEATSGFLSHPRISRDGQSVAFLDHPVRYDDAGGLAVVDRTGRKKTLVSDFLTIWGLSWSAEGKEVWFTGTPVGTNRALYAATLDGGRRLVSRVIGSTRLNDVSSSGRALLTQDQRREHVIALAPGETRERDLSWLDYSLGRAISDDGRTLLFVEGGEGAGPIYAVFLRRTDGSPAVRLGDGDAQALSRDGKSALAILRKGGETRLVVYPTGPGAARMLASTTLELSRADFLPDARRLLLSAGEAGHGSRLYLQSVEGGPPMAISPDGYAAFSGTISRDGKAVVARGPERRLYLFPLEGGEPTLLATLLPDDVPCGWSQDGRLYVASSSPTGLAEGASSAPASKRVDLLDVATGVRRPWKELGTNDGASAIHVTPDGRSYTYSYVHTQADLYLVEGLR